MAQEPERENTPPTPAADEGKKYYNIPYRDVYRRSELNEETKQEFLFSGAEDVPPFNIPEGAKLMARIEELASEFSPPFAPFDPTGKKQGAAKTSAWFADSGRTLVVGFADPKQINRDNCARIQAMLSSEFPLWRVVVAATGKDTLSPIIYPTAIAIPSAWREKETEYWEHIRSIEEKNNVRQDELERVVVEHELKKTYSNVTGAPDDLPRGDKGEGQRGRRDKGGHPYFG